MNSPCPEPVTPLERLLSYHRLLRLVETECEGALDEDSTARVIALILEKIQALELPAAAQLEQAREGRGLSV